MKIRNMLLCGLLAASCALSVGCASGDTSSDSGAETNDVSVSDTAEADAPASSAAVGNIGDVELKTGDLIAEFEIEGYGTIKAKLFPDVAPKGVDNFVKLANEGFYDGLTVHRVVKGFMLQGGSLNGDGTGGEAADGGSFGIETNENMRHFYGALCYANAGGQNTCQFYIVNNNEPQDLAAIDLAMIKENAEVCGIYKTMYEEGSDGYLYYSSMETYYGNLAEMIETASDDIKDKYKDVGGTPTLDGGYTVFGQVYEGFNVIDGISNAPVELNDGGELSKPLSTITITSVKITEYAG